MRIQLIKNEIKEDFPDLCKIADQCEKHSPVVYFLSIPIYKESLMCTKLEDQWAEPVSLTFHCFQKTLHRTFLPNFGSFGYSVSEKIFLEITRKKNCLWWPCLLTDQDEMSNLYRRPTIDPSYQVLVRIHLAKR